MNCGWMWHDNDPSTPIEEKIGRAVDRYRQRFNRWPNTCFLNEQHVEGDGFQHGRVKVVPVPNVLPWHFWLVQDGEKNGV